MTRIFPTGGALLPPNLEWQVGKTVASIDFVNRIEQFIKDNPQHKNVEMLRKLMQQVIEGTVIFNKPVNLEPYLQDIPRGGLPPNET